MECVRFSVNRDEQGKVNGFTLMGVGKMESEAFCLSFVTAQQRGKGEILFEDGKIVFRHGGVSMEEANPAFNIFGTHEGGAYSHYISPEDSDMLSALLKGSGPYKDVEIRVRLEVAFGKGFTLYIRQ